MRKDIINTIGLLSLIHSLVDFLCIFSLFRKYGNTAEAILLYNFCAFALQMPFGLVLDILQKDRKNSVLPGVLFTEAGILFTVIGSMVSPVLSGIGNALFHCGGGVLTIGEDRKNGMQGRGLGVFVAPGAFGVAFGLLLYQTEMHALIRMLVSAALVLCGIWTAVSFRGRSFAYVSRSGTSKDIIPAAAACFLVVVLRSMAGLGIAFSWKTGTAAVLLSTACTALGKAVGGFLAASCGMKKTILCSLLLSALFYLAGNQMASGLAALLLFNMTMPLTLYLLADVMPDTPGFAFGILTFALFVGYLPVQYGLFFHVHPAPAGAVLSLVSLLLLVFAAWKAGTS